MKSIQTKFIMLILGCVILCAIFIGGGAIYSVKEVTNADSSKIMNSQSQEARGKFDSLLLRIEQSVKTLSVYTLEELDSVEKLKTDESYVEEYTKRLQSVAINAANNTEGALAVYVRFNPDFTSPSSGLFWSRSNLGGEFQELPPTNLSNYSPTDVEHVGWYYIPVQNGKEMWMEPYINENINIRMISYVIPLYKDNEVIGVVGMDINFEIFEKLAGEIQVYDTGYAFLSDTSGNIMYHPEYPMFTQLENTESELKKVISGAKNESSGKQLFSYTYDGERKKMAYNTLNNGMRLIVTAPLSEINAVQNKLIIQSVISLVIVCFISVVLTIFMSRRLVRPLRELTAAAKKIASGDLTISLTKPSNDEVGALAESFQKTVNQLQKYIQYINGLAYRDGLTGVKNKTAYQEAEKRMEDQMRIGRPQFAVAVMDINDLKNVNDNFGHDFGDMLIITTCNFICRIFKRSPVYRVGGDEFVVIMENSDYENHIQLMEEFNSEMEKYNRSVPPENQMLIASGIAVYSGETDLVFSNVFKRADDEMYKKKAEMKRESLESD